MQVELAAVRALWELHRDAEAKAAVPRLVPLLRVEHRDDVLELAHFLRSERRQPASAWAWLAPLVAGGCDVTPYSSELCREAGHTLAAMDSAAPTWGAEALRAAPQNPKRHWHWMQFVAGQAATRGPAAPPAVLAWLLTDAARQPAAMEGWWLAYGVARTLPGDDPRASWRAAVTAATTPTATLLQVANQVAWQEDRASCSELLRVATARGDQPEAPGLLAAALARQDDAEGLARLSADGAPQFTTPVAQLSLVRALLAVRQGTLAAQFLSRWGTPNAEWQALRAEAARQTGNQDAARALVASIDTAPGDRSLAWLIVGETWRRSHPGEAQHSLERAATTPGLGQRTAAALRAQWLVAGHRTAASTAAVLTYARLLEPRTALPGAGGAALAVTPAVEDARRELLAWIALPEWQEVSQAVVQGFAGAGVAPPEQLREVAVQAAQREDLDAFLAVDAQARAVADERFVALPTKGLFLQLLRRGPWLARWLQEAGTRDLDDGQLLWSGAAVLFESGFGSLAQQLLGVALARTAVGDFEPPPPQLQKLAISGAADQVLGEVARRRAAAAGKPMDPGVELLEALALLATGKPDAAAQVLDQTANRPDLPTRTLRPLLDLAAQYGLCATVRTLAPRLMAESDLYSLRAGLEQGLTCARRQGDAALARSLVKVAYGARLDANRLDSAARALVQAGFFAIALDIFPQLAQLRPPSDETLLDWAKALLASGMADQAADLLRGAQTNGRQVARLWRHAWNLFENYGEPVLAVEFARKTLAFEPDAPSVRSRLIAMLLRLDQRAAAASELAILAESGMDDRDAVTILTFARRARAQRPLLEVLVARTNLDRDSAWLRGELAADLSDRAAVQSTLQQLRSKNTSPPPEAVQWLGRVGLLHDARQAAVDQLASSEPLGMQRDRSQLLTAAVELRHDPGSEQELLGLVRIYLSRAARADVAALETAALLSALGWPRQADAVAQTLGPDAPPQLATVAANFAWQAGRRQAALATWQRIRGQLTVDDELREVLKSANLSNLASLRDRGSFVALWRTWSYLERAGQHSLLLAWVAELLQLAPDSEFLHAQRIQWLVQSGRLGDAKTALAVARQRLPRWGRELAATANLLAREAGAASLIDSLRIVSPATAAKSNDGRSGPDATAVTGTVEPLRTNSWWLALLVSVGDLPPEIVGPIQRLQANLPELRTELAVRLAAIGRGPEAIQTLGKQPLVCQQEQLAHTAAAMAAALVAVQGQAPAGTLAPLAVHTLQGWLQNGYGADAAVRLAVELTRQGHPELATLALKQAPAAQLAGQLDGLEQRLLALVAVGSDSEVVEAALAFTKGNRSVYNVGSDAERQGEPVEAVARSFADDAMDLLVVAGRSSAAAALAQALRESEPSVGIAAGIEAAAPAPLVERARAWQPAALDELGQHPESATPAELQSLLDQFAARGPDLAWNITSLLAKTAEEGWRLWLALAQSFLASHDPEPARRALERAKKSGAPAAALACPQTALGERSTAEICWRNQHLADMEPADLGALAAPLAGDPSGTLAADLAAEATTSTATGFARVVAALADRVADLGETARSNLGGWLTRVLDGMAEPVRRMAVLTAMEDLGDFGLGHLGVTAARGMLQRHPSGHSSHNDYAYSLFLAGQAGPEALQHGRQAEWSTDAEPAMAGLDTLAAILDRLGQSQAALDVQRRSLASGAVEWRQGRDASRRERANKPPMALPMARYAEFLVKLGQFDEARRVAAQALRLAELDEDREEPSATSRLRKVLRTVLRSAAPAAPSKAVP